MTQKFATDYIDVAARLVEFRTKYPEGSLQPADPATPYRIEEIGGKQRIVVVAAAYRTPDDVRPGIGMAYEEVPGRTPYTRDSELQNAETSAWGRAIVAALAADTKKGIASAEEVRNRMAEREDGQPTAEDFHRKHNRMVAQTLEDEKKAGRRKKGTEPADDPWAKPVETDQEWLNAWVTRVAEAKDKDALQVLWAEMVEKHKNLQCNDADRAELTETFKNAAAALEPAA